MYNVPFPDSVRVPYFTPAIKKDILFKLRPFPAPPAPKSIFQANVADLYADEVVILE